MSASIEATAKPDGRIHVKVFVHDDGSSPYGEAMVSIYCDPPSVREWIASLTKAADKADTKVGS